MAEDLFAQLWPSSYKGVPFWSERDDEEGGRRLDVAEFPYSDVPFVENLGQKAKRFRVTAYVVDADYLADAAALTAVFDGAGAGTLVLPEQGPVQAHCAHFRRAREKDRTGYVAFEAEFVRDGAPTPVLSVDYSAQLALDSAAGAADAGMALAAQIAVVGAPSWVVAGAVAALQDGVAALDAIRAAAPVDPTQSQALGQTLGALYAAIPAAVTNTGGVDATQIVPPLFAAALALSAAIPAATAADAFGDAADALAQPPVPVLATANAAVAAANAGALARLARLALMAGYLQAVVDAPYESRPDGVAAKVMLVYRFDREMDLCFGAPDEAVYVALGDMRAAGVTYLDALVTTLAPILTVTTGVALPSLVAAHAIYADEPDLDLGARARDLVLRNGVKHPSYMPTVFEALAPALAA